MKRMTLILATSFLVLLFMTFAQTSTPLPSITKANAAPGSYFDYVVTILMENNGINDVCGGSVSLTQPACGTSVAPYMGALANLNSLALHYTGTSHPSEGNYISLIGGSNFGHTGDGYCCFGINSPNVIDRIEGAGLTWQAFAEDASGSGTCSFNPPRGADHFPFLTFSDMNTAARCSHFLTTSSSSDPEFIAALNSATPPNYLWLTPNDNDNMHDSGCCSVGDNYLSLLVPQILTSKVFTTQKAALFIVYDEGNDYCPIDGSGADCVYASWAGPVAKKVFTSAASYNHYSYLRTIENNWNLATLQSSDAAASGMGEFFGTFTPPPPSPSFTYSPSNPQTGQTVTFTGTVSGGTPPYSYSWNFGDTSTGTGSSPTHMYNTAGSYTVALNVQDSASKTGSTSKTLTVAPPPQPDFTINANPSTLNIQTGGSAPSTITVTSTGGFTGSVSLTASTVSGTSTSFNPTSLSPPAGGSASSTLTFNVGSSSSPGTYSFTITGASGSVSHTSTVTVTVTSQTPLSASFTYNPSNPQTGQTIAFTGTVSGGTTPYSYSWNFGDGSTGTGRLPTHVYNTAGTYNVVLNVHDSASKTGSTSQTLTVTQAQAPDFTISANPSSLTAQAGNSNSSTITVTPVNGFGDDVALTVFFSGSGPSASFSPGTVTGGLGTATLTIATTSSTTQGTYSVIVTGSSPTVTKSVTLTFTVVAMANNPPVVTVLGPLTAATGSVVTLKASAYDPDPGETIVLGASGLPTGATFDPTTGILSWKPESNQVGTYTITFTATDNGTPSLTSSQPVTLQVISPSNGGCVNSCSSFPIPSSGIWLAGLGGLFTLVLSLVVLNVRSQSRLRHARKLNRLDD